MDLAGSTIEAIDGTPVPVLYERLARFAGGVEAQRKLALSLLLESPGLLHAAGLAQLPDRLTLQVRLPGNRFVERTIRAVSGQVVPRGFGAERLLSPVPTGTSERNWTPAISLEQAPLALLDGNTYFRHAPLLNGAALYVQFRLNTSFAGQDIDTFQQQVLAAIDTQHPKDVVLDLRFDTGGDLESTLPFMRTLPGRVPGKVYVLISRYTFSAGIVSAAVVKKAGGAKVVLVGEPVGDRPRFWSEGDSSCLPHSGFCLHYTDGLFDLAKGCRNEDGCYGDQFDATVGRLDPEYPRSVHRERLPRWAGSGDGHGPRQNQVMRSGRIAHCMRTLLTSSTTVICAALVACALDARTAASQTLVENSSEIRFQLDLHVPEAALTPLLPPGFTLNVATQGPAKDCNLRAIFVNRLTVNGPDGKPVGKGSNRLVYLAAPVKDASGANAQVVIGGLTADAADAPGPFGNYLHASTATAKRSVSGDGLGVTETQDWVFKAASGEQLELHITFERGVANRGGASDTKFYSAKDPSKIQDSRSRNRCSRSSATRRRTRRTR
ncbi:MAG: hypothetical protein QM736_24245 [Vicinamibacterales bacterium]